jgi:hypothetical protein
LGKGGVKIGVGEVVLFPLQDASPVISSISAIWARQYSLGDFGDILSSQDMFVGFSGAAGLAGAMSAAPPPL